MFRSEPLAITPLLPESKEIPLLPQPMVLEVLAHPMDTPLATPFPSILSTLMLVFRVKTTTPSTEMLRPSAELEILCPMWLLQTHLAVVPIRPSTLVLPAVPSAPNEELPKLPVSSLTGTHTISLERSSLQDETPPLILDLPIPRSSELEIANVLLAKIISYRLQLEQLPERSLLQVSLRAPTGAEIEQLFAPKPERTLEILLPPLEFPTAPVMSLELDT